ncbi:DNA methylase domain protein [Leptospira interrogans serovar Lora str. TE 1992]|nr:DNA methylase domain protein [Leptospira interrogans serovar Lora str. TE 1992]
MYSLKGDIVLDPFLGTGTTTLAAIGNCRNSIGFDLEPGLLKVQLENLHSIKDKLNRIIEKRKTITTFLYRIDKMKGNRFFILIKIFKRP